jgi:hypothetical protein
MRIAFLAAAVASFVMPAVAQEGPPRGGPPAYVVSQANLARAGVLPLYYSEREYGLLQTRAGESRARIGNATSPAGPAADYEHHGYQATAPFYFRFHQEGTTSYVMGRLSFNFKREEDNATQADSTGVLPWIGYQNFYAPNAMWGVQLGGLRLRSEGEATKAERDSINLRFDYARVLNDNWGFAGRLYFSTGENTVTIKGPGISYTQDEDQVYIQGEFAGNFTSEDLAAVPQGWAFQPVLGANFQRYFLDDTTNSVGAPEPGGEFDVGNVWARASLTKLAKPGQWSPSVTLGLEHAYQDDYGDFIDEDTHASVRLGAAVLLPGGGNTIAVALDHRVGLNGHRSNTQLLTSFNFSF